jgi:hypothetical protein
MIFDKIRINITDNNLVNFIRLHAIRNGIGFSIADSISADIENKSRSICLPLYSERVSKFLENTDGFYSIANQRSKSIIKNCLNQLNLENELAGILVTGGFHRNTITTYLKEMKIPFIVLQPKTELSEEDDKRYISAVLENRKNN